MKVDYNNNLIFRLFLLVLLFNIIFSINVLAEEKNFNDDLEKITSDYIYYEGFNDDKILYNKMGHTWSIKKGDGNIKNLKGDYLAYANTVEGKYYNFNDDYYQFLIRNEYGTSSFVYVSKDGTESLVEGYSYAAPTLNKKYLYIWNYDESGNQKTGLYDIENKYEVLPVLYDSLDYINNITIVAVQNSKYGIIDINSLEITPFEYDYLQYVNENFIIASKNNIYGILDIEMNPIVQFQHDKIISSNNIEGYCKVFKDNKVGLISTDLNLFIQGKYDDIFYSYDDLFVVQQDGKVGIVDINTNVVVPFIYDFISPYNGLLIGYKDGLAGILDKGGNEILPFRFSEIFDFNENQATVIISEDNYTKYAVYDTNGNEIIPPIYDYIDYSSSQNYYIAKKDGYANLIHKESKKEILPWRYSDIQYLTEKYIAASYDGHKYGVINNSCQELTPFIYESIYMVEVDGNELIGCALENNDNFFQNVDYFKLNNGPSSWASDEISLAINNGMVPFELQISFRANITREDFCKLIIAYIENKSNILIDDIIIEKNINQYSNPFIDTNCKEIVVCNYFGIVNGKGNGIFDPTGEITREEASVILTNLLRYYEIDISSKNYIFGDENNISYWAKKAINYVFENNIMLGIDADTFSPKSNMTREQAIIILYRMLTNMN